MSYSDTLATIALFVSVLGTVFSCLFSYNLSIKAEKRKEFNLIADKINPFLREENRNGGERSISSSDDDS